MLLSHRFVLIIKSIYYKIICNWSGCRINHPLCPFQKNSKNRKVPNVLTFFKDLFKVALYTKGSTIHLPTWQFGDLKFLWNCLYRQTFLYIVIAQWSRALVLWSAHHEFKSAGHLCYWNKFLKVIFLPKNDFSFAFCTFISVICYFIFHHQNISSWFKKLYPGVMSHRHTECFSRTADILVVSRYVKRCVEQADSKKWSV